MPIDPLSVQKIEIFRGPEALRLRLAGGRRRGGGDQQPHSLRCAARRLADANPGSHDHGRPRPRRRRPVRRRHAQLRDPCRLLRAPCQRLFHPELSLSLPHRSGAAVQRQAAELRPAFRGPSGRRLLPVRRRLCGRRASPASPALYRIPTMEGAATNTRIDLEQTKFTSKGEFRPQSSAIDVVRFWLGAVEYHHDELGTRRRRPRRRARDVQQPRPGGQDRDQVHAAAHAARRPDQRRRHTVRPPADRHRGRRRRPARLGPHQPGRRLFLQRALADRHAAHAAGGPHRDRSSRRHRPAYSRRRWFRRRTIRCCRCNRSASRPRASASACSRTCRPGWSPAPRCSASSARPRRSSCSPTARTTHRARSISATRP